MNTTTTPPLNWFRDPGLTEPTPLTVTPDGRVFGHLCEWNRAHIAFGGRKVYPPRGDDMRFFLTGATDVIDDDGKTIEISVGKLTMNTGHASTAMNVTPEAAARHYDDTGTIAALVNAGNDGVGIWLAGAMLPDVDQFTARRFRSCGVSGDWRQIDGALRLVAALSVPVGGFPIPRARVASGAPLALVAAGALSPVAFGRKVAPDWKPASSSPAGFDAEAFADAVADRLAARQRAAELTARRAELLGQVDDAPKRYAALLASLDDAGVRRDALLAELDDEDVAELANWVEKAGGLPEYIKRIAKHLEKKPGFDKSRAIATAVNAAKRMCATGDLNFPGVQQVNAGSRAEACAAVADWERKKAQSKAD